MPTHPPESASDQALHLKIEQLEAQLPESA